MLDIRFIREKPEIVKKDLEKRKEPEKIKWLQELIEKDREYRELLQKSQKLRHEHNVINQEINQLKKQGKDISKKLKIARSIPKELNDIEEKIAEVKEKINYYLMRLPNILHKSVPFGTDEAGNKVIRKFGTKPKFSFKLKNHGELLEKRKLANFDDAAKVAGNGFYYLLGNG